LGIDPFCEDFTMRTTASSRRRRPVNKPRPARPLLLLEHLEDRTLPSSGQWYAVFHGMTPGETLEEQTQLGQNLLHSAGVLEQDVTVDKALDLSGTFILQTPPNVTEQTLTSELQEVPNFVFVQDYEQEPDASPEGQPEPEEEEDGGDLVNLEYYEQTY